MNVVMTNVDKLIPYVNNARTHSDSQVTQIAASIKEFGFTNPILTDGENGIIAGHGRLMAAKKLGITEVPVIELAHLSKAQKKAYILADNKLALNAGWDNELLAIELGELKAFDFDLNLTGFDAVDIDGLILLDKDKNPEKIEDVSEDLPGAQALKLDMQFPSKLKWGMPELRRELLVSIPKNIATWAGPDATPDDGESFYLGIGVPIRCVVAQRIGLEFHFIRMTIDSSAYGKIQLNTSAKC